MENIYTEFFRGKCRHNLPRSISLPLFNTNQKKYKKILSPNILKIQMMEERLNQLEKQKQEQNKQIDLLMSYQMEQNRLSQNYNPNSLVLSANNILPNIGYHLNQIKPIKKKFDLKKFKNIMYMKEKKLDEYRNIIGDLKKLLEKERTKRKRNRYMKNNIYLPLKQDINCFMNDMNHKIQKKIQNDNNMITANISEVQNSYDELKYFLNNKMNKLEIKQKKDFENLKCELINTVRQNEKETEILNELIESKIDNNINQIYSNLDEQLRYQRELDDIKHKKEMEELKQKCELEKIQNRKIRKKLKLKNLRNKIINKKLIFNHYPMPFMNQMPNFTYSYNNLMNYSNYS